MIDSEITVTRTMDTHRGAYFCPFIADATQAPGHQVIHCLWEVGGQVEGQGVAVSLCPLFDVLQGAWGQGG